MSAHGGKREGAGRPKGVDLPPKPDKAELITLYEALNRPARPTDSYRVQKWRKLTESKDQGIALRAEMYLADQNYGRATQPHTLAGDEHRPIMIVNKIERPKR